MGRQRDTSQARYAAEPQGGTSVDEGEGAEEEVGCAGVSAFIVSYSLLSFPASPGPAGLLMLHAAGVEPHMVAVHSVGAHRRTGAGASDMGEWKRVGPASNAFTQTGTRRKMAAGSRRLRGLNAGIGYTRSLFFLLLTFTYTVWLVFASYKNRRARDIFPPDSTFVTEGEEKDLVANGFAPAGPCHVIIRECSLSCLSPSFELFSIISSLVLNSAYKFVKALLTEGLPSSLGDLLYIVDQLSGILTAFSNLHPAVQMESSAQ
ncbi:hypothetical protein MSAN_01126200 [Mycena sanguinolenta]|uniref:Uncharacterized protein n=1 Tax=Mycena sanguinolenta TaxID=230812 RepID=A0A8H6YLL4_9AGAR|nr:hypothetical protein MSAN_01126200 [Mycena sanguinolenta]